MVGGAEITTSGLQLKFNSGVTKDPIGGSKGLRLPNIDFCYDSVPNKMLEMGHSMVSTHIHEA